MRLKLKRSQRDGGIISKTVVFCLDAQAQFTTSEQASIVRYKLHNEVIYNSEASKRLLDRGSTHQDGSLSGSFKSLALSAMAAMKLNITIASLQRGEHVECKSLDELLAAEEAIMTACRNLRGYLDIAATFDGREVLLDFDTAEPQVIAHTRTPEPILVATSATPETVEAADVRSAASPAVEDLPHLDRPAPSLSAVVGDSPVSEGETYQPFDNTPAGPFGSLSSGQQLALILGGLFVVLMIVSGVG